MGVLTDEFCVWCVYVCVCKDVYIEVVSNGKYRWCDVKGSLSLPEVRLNSNEVNTRHRL